MYKVLLSVYVLINHSEDAQIAPSSFGLALAGGQRAAVREPTIVAASSYTTEHGMIHISHDTA
jgi:hypothetical protein